jgi:hypothetical protein
MKLSTGLRNKLLDNDDIKGLFNLSFIKIYSGSEPASADDAVTGTLLCTVSNNGTGTGLTFAASASGGAISKNGSETWKGTNAATGTAGYFRLVAAGDDGTSSTTQARIQGSVGLAGEDMNLSSVSLTSAAEQTIDYFTIALPAA